jgi:hypothetical protein
MRKHDETHEHRPGGAINDCRGCLVYIGMPAEIVLNLFQLNPEAAELHLIVRPAKVLESAVRTAATQITGPVSAYAASRKSNSRNRSAVKSGRFR